MLWSLMKRQNTLCTGLQVGNFQKTRAVPILRKQKQIGLHISCTYSQHKTIFGISPNIKWKKYIKKINFK